MGYKLMILAGVTTLVSEVLQDISYNTIRSIIGYLYLGFQIYLNDVCKAMKGIQIYKQINYAIYFYFNKREREIEREREICSFRFTRYRRNRKLKQNNNKYVL